MEIRKIETKTGGQKRKSYLCLLKKITLKPSMFLGKLSAFFIVAIPFFLKADIKLPGIISDGMVLQRDMPISLWGWASPGEKIEAILGTQSIRTKADENGSWIVEFAPLKASSAPIELTVNGQNTVKINNILLGDVWLCSGQSNMAMSVKNSMEPQKEIGNANNPLIRILRVPLVSSFSPRKDIDISLTGGWQPCSPSTIPDFSAVGYYFGRELFKELDVPIGLIQAAWVGTPVIAWTSAKSTEKFRDVVIAYDKCLKEKEKEFGFQPADTEKMQDWTKTQLKLAKTDVELLRKLRKAESVYRRIPSNLYNGMIAPLIPFGIRGVIWYQGEDDVAKAYTYRELFRTLIRDWRSNWGHGDFPFYFVQLANWNADLTLSYAELRESQAAVLDEPNTGMAVTIDIGEHDNVHPKNKQEAGRRLALVALAKTYGRKINFAGPVFASMKLSEDKITVKFDNAEGGLICKDGRVKGFTLAEENPEYVKIERKKGSGNMVEVPKFYPAEARIQGDEIILWNENLKKPFAVRYGWENSPECNLYNKSGHPACPFRTDTWKGIWQ